MPHKEDDPFFDGGGKMPPPRDDDEARERRVHSDIYDDDDEEAGPNNDRENYEERSGGHGKPGATSVANDEQLWMASTMSALGDAPDAMQRSIRAMLASAPRKRAKTAAASANAPRVRVYTPEETGALNWGVPAEAPLRHDGDIGEEVAQTNTTMPPPPKAYPLEEALRKIAMEQSEVADIAADLAGQGKGKPTRYGDFRDWASQQSEAVIMCGMGDGPFVEPVHSIFKYAASGRAYDPHNNT